MKRIDTVIGIDPDVDRNGVATLNVKTAKMEVRTLTFPDLMDYLRYCKQQAEVIGKTWIVAIEAGWLNKSHWHLKRGCSTQYAAAVGNGVGANHETGRKIAEMCAHWEIPYELVKPLALTVGGLHLWSGKDGKITAEELAEVTGVTARTNQEGRDAALIAWTYAGLPMRTGYRPRNKK